MTKYIFKNRQKGKTIDLILMAKDCNGYIVVKDIRRASHVFAKAKELGIDINFPITFKEAEEYRGYNKNPNFYIDDAHELFNYVFAGGSVKAATFDMEDIELNITSKYQEYMEKK